MTSSPQLEDFRARGIEVLMLSDPADSFWASAAPEFEGKPLKSVMQGSADLGLIPLLDGASLPHPKPTMRSHRCSRR